MIRSTFGGGRPGGAWRLAQAAMSGVKAASNDTGGRHDERRPLVAGCTMDRVATAQC